MHYVQMQQGKHFFVYEMMEHRPNLHEVNNNSRTMTGDIGRSRYKAQQEVILVGILSLDTSWSATTKGTVQGNVLLAVHPNNEGWHIDNLLANPAATVTVLKKTVY